MELAMKLLEKDIHEKQVSTHFHPVSIATDLFRKRLGRADMKKYEDSTIHRETSPSV